MVGHKGEGTQIVNLGLAISDAVWVDRVVFIAEICVQIVAWQKQDLKFHKVLVVFVSIEL